MDCIFEPELFRTWCNQVRREAVAAAEARAPLGLVLTMGALHAGHVSLISQAQRRARRVAVSVFVNPTQFGPNEDLAKYPRDLASDLAVCERAGVDVVFTPTAAQMYRPGDETRVQVSELASGLCGATRPGHFTGVCTVVAKFFNLAGPCVALFGQKDYQQLKVLERMVEDLFLPIEIVGAPIHREGDGLAMSSRNRYLSELERQRALSLVRALSDVHAAFAKGERDKARLYQTALAALAKGQAQIDYVDFVDAQNLRVADQRLPEANVVLAIAAKIGKTRLIDNCRLDQAFLATPGVQEAKSA